MRKEEQFQQTLLRKTVVITGSSSGVGRAAAEAFALEGCNIVIVARGQKGIDEVVELCKGLGVEVLGISADTSIATDIERVAEETLSRFGRIDIWVNNAGVMASGKFEEIPMEIHEQVIKTNLFGYMHGAYNAIKIFKKQNEGILINNVSIGGYMPAPYSSVYSATKYGIKGMMDGLQGEISNYANIHVCNLYPQLQKSTGNLHSAKYSGFKMGIPPIASDPRDTAAKMVELARKPKKDLFPDFRSYAITSIYRLFPKEVINTASAGVRLMMKIKNGPEVSGNILKPSQDPHKIYGRPPLNTSKNIKVAVLIGIVAGFAVIGLKKGLVNKSNKSIG
ncbi:MULTISPECIES: SDR family NAD(P)-dependent oxidoreductase [Elizabethkingia]|uniref:SDR family NAD(P)-dependent oxidoreductase n=1 Tax=Elizabethkingia TaxID=308865 RepID=UPI0023B104CF|nr:SDR family NAD(P)-dependent oxidoreductase [Elizabethkingia meningoseptica]MDE5518202.1 SDR family NAD(P)-dependent oxidoreductase [Elizabethkingia meningoseptica]